MFKKAALLIVLVFVSFGLLCQKFLSKKELISLQNLYGIAIDSFVEKRPSHFVLIDSSDNTAIKTINFSDLAKRFHLDSSWSDFLQVADLKKATLQKIKLAKITTIHTVRYFNRDTIFKIQRKNHDTGAGIVEPYGWIDGVMTVSSPIFSAKKDKAIIEISYTKGELDGKGGIVILEKKNNKWSIVKCFRTWVA